MLRAVDLFCGAGGTTCGAKASGHVDVRLAVNHWPTAITTHRQNHPDVRHVCAPIDLVDPRDFTGMGLDVVLASPECIFHSNARGGKPIDDQRRATAWCVPRWAEVIRPKWLIIENVREFADWSPIGSNGRPLKSKKGEIFQAWVNTLRALNYHVEWKLLNAADFGGATKRVRLFIVARRGPSTKPIPWPAITHSRANWVPASSIIDWALPCPSIFGRKRPLADKTLQRIEIGLRKFCGPGAEPFIVKMRGTSNAGSARDPLPTVTGGGNHEALAVPFQLQLIGRGAGRVHGVNEPLPTIVAARENHCQRHGLAVVQLMQTMRDLGVVDVGFRMLEPHELAAAQGFDPSYEIYGTKAEQVKQIGNSVHTHVARALCGAIGGAA